MANLNYTKAQVDEAVGKGITSGLVVLLYSDDSFSGEILGVNVEGSLKDCNLVAENKFSHFIIESEVRAKHIIVDGAEIHYVFKIVVNEVAVKTITPVISNENVGGFIGGVYIFPLKCTVENADPGNPLGVEVKGFFSLEGGQVSAHSLRVYGVLQ